MIVGQQKPLEEIKKTISAFTNILVLGCGTCVKTCFAGGEDEVATLSSALRLSFKKDGVDINIEELTIERQCEDEFIQEAAQSIKHTDAVLSLACGAGVQAIAERFPKVPVMPGVNTTFIGILEKQGLFMEECLGCGDCKLALFGSICPVTRCSKKLLNGPCGGSQNGKCEVNPETDCAWHLIIERLKNLGQLDSLKTYVEPKDWRSSNSGGPRKLVREDHII